MATEGQRTIRAKNRFYRALKREESLNRLRRDFRAVAIAAKLDVDRLPDSEMAAPNGERLLQFSEVPKDYPKFLDELGMASPKVRRMGFHILKIWDRMDDALFMHIFENSLFDYEGRLKSKEIGELLQDAYQSLLEEIRRLRAGHALFIPLEKAMQLISLRGKPDKGREDLN